MKNITISFKATEEQARELDRFVKMGHFTSRGEYLRSLLREEMEMELSDEAIRDIEEARKEKGGTPIDEL